MDEDMKQIRFTIPGEEGIELTMNNIIRQVFEEGRYILTKAREEKIASLPAEPLTEADFELRENLERLNPEQDFSFWINLQDTNFRGNWYFTGEQRTGCCVCGFGCHLEPVPNRLQRLRTSDNDKHRRMCEGCLQIKNHGMTYEQALNYAGIPTEEVQEDE